MEKIIGTDGKAVTSYGDYEVLNIRQLTKEEIESLPIFEWSQESMSGNEWTSDNA